MCYEEITVSKRIHHLVCSLGQVCSCIFDQLKFFIFSQNTDSNGADKLQKPHAGSANITTAVATAPPKGCPVDKNELGRNTWSFLHTMAAYYPEEPTAKQQKDMNNFIKLFSRFYPCDWCSYHMRERWDSLIGLLLSYSTKS